MKNKSQKAAIVKISLNTVPQFSSVRFKHWTGMELYIVELTGFKRYISAHDVEEAKKTFWRWIGAV